MATGAGETVQVFHDFQQGAVTILFGLTAAQQIQVRPIDDEDISHYLYLRTRRPGTWLWGVEVCTIKANLSTIRRRIAGDRRNTENHFHSARRGFGALTKPPDP